LQFILERCQIVQGWAIRAAEPIPQGTFVCEYVGEVLKTDEAMKNGERFVSLFLCFLFIPNLRKIDGSSQLPKK